MRNMTHVLPVLLIAGGLTSAATVSADYNYSDWGHDVYPVGSEKHLHAYVDSAEPNGQLPFAYAARWYANASGASNSPEGNTWAKAGGFCDSTWVESDWAAPDTTSNFGGGASVSCPDGTTYDAAQAFGQVASESYSRFSAQ
jgi:hypothetical protein